MLDFVIKAAVVLLAVAIVGKWICYTIKSLISRESVGCVIRHGLRRGDFKKVDIGLRKTVQAVDIQKLSDGAEVKFHLTDSRGNRENIKIISSKGTTLRIGSKIAIR